MTPEQREALLALINAWDDYKQVTSKERENMTPWEEMVDESMIQLLDEQDPDDKLFEYNA